MKKLIIFISLISCSMDQSILKIPEITVNTPNFDPTTVDSPILGSIKIDSSVFSDKISTASIFLTCVNQPTGPFSRFQTNPKNTGPVNFIEADIFLPNNPAKNENYPYIYSGGQPKNGLNADIGFQSDINGVWIPVINVDGDSENIKPFGKNGKPALKDLENFIYRILPDQKVHIKTWISQENMITFSITAIWRKFRIISKSPFTTQDSNENINTTVMFNHSRATGWSPSGTDQVFKMMTTISFPGDGDFKSMTQSGQGFEFNGSSWSNISVGMADKDGTVKTRQPFTSALAYQSKACSAPSDMVQTTGTLPNITVKLTLRKKGTYSRAPNNTIELKGTPGQIITSKITIRNTGTPGSIVTLNFTPPGKSFINARIASGQSTDVPFEYACPQDKDAELEKQFRVVYSENETAAPGDLGDPIAKSGDLKFVAGKDIVLVKLRCVSPIRIVLGQKTVFSATGRGFNALNSTSVVALDSFGNKPDVDWTWSTTGVTLEPHFSAAFVNSLNPNVFYASRVGTYRVTAKRKNDPTILATADVTVVPLPFERFAMGVIKGGNWSVGWRKLNPPNNFPLRCYGNAHFEILTSIDGTIASSLNNLNLIGLAQQDVMHTDYVVPWDDVIQSGACADANTKARDSLRTRLPNVLKAWQSKVLPGVKFTNARVLFDGTDCNTFWTSLTYGSYGCFVVDLVGPVVPF